METLTKIDVSMDSIILQELSLPHGQIMVMVDDRAKSLRFGVCLGNIYKLVQI